MKADVAGAGDTIVTLAAGVAAGARRVIDAQGLVVAPGFMHTHSDSALLEDDRAASFLMQGVTSSASTRQPGRFSARPSAACSA